MSKFTMTKQIFICFHFEVQWDVFKICIKNKVKKMSRSR